MKIYTRTGDDGNTGLQGGLRISKAHARIAAYGAVDEANAALGVTASGGSGARAIPDDVSSVLARLQNELFVVGADLSNPNLADLRNRVTPGMTNSLENVIDRFESELPPLSSFILPGGGLDAARLHHVRTVVRRAESLAVRLSETEEINLHCITYLNRLSDLLFVLARVLNRRLGHGEIPWRPGNDGAAGDVDAGASAVRTTEDVPEA